MSNFKVKSPEHLQPLFTEGFNLSKYNINNLGSLPNVEITDELLTLSSPAFTIIANGSKVYVFKEEPVFEVAWEILLDSKCVSLCLSDDYSLLLVAEQTAIVRLLHLVSKRVLWSYEIEDNGNPCTLKRVVCSESSSFLTIYAYADGCLYEFSTIGISSLYKAMNEDCVSDFFCNVHAERIEFPDTYPEYLTAFETFNPTFPIGFRGVTKVLDMSMSDFYTIEDMVDGDFVSDWEFNAEDEKCFSFYDFSAYTDSSVAKVTCTKSGQYIICLSEKKTILIFCAFTQQLLNEWGDRDIENFVLKDTVDPENHSKSDCQVGILRKLNNMYLFEIRKFPSFDLIYKFQVPGIVHLCECKSNQAAWYFVDKEPSTVSKTFCTLNIKSLSESSPEARLLSLLNRRKFKEAEVYAKMSCLDPEVIYKTKMSYMLENYLKNPNSTFSEDETGSLCKEIDSLLGKIKDVEFMKTCIISVIEEEKILKKFILCIRTWLSANIDAKGVQDLVCEINRKENKLLTYEMLPESTLEILSLKEFFKKDLLQFMTSELVSGCLTTALIIWQRHKDEILEILSTVQINEILNAVSCIPSRLLIPFLENEFLPAVLSKIPEAAVIVAEWIISKIHLLELSEKDSWPNNGLKLGSLFFDIIQRLIQKSDAGAINFSSVISLASNNKELTNPDSCIGCLFQLLRNLKILSKLKKTFNCKIPLAAFLECKTDIIYAVLDRIDTKNIVHVITEFATPFALESLLDLDLCLQLYVETTIKNSCLTWWSWHEEPWEEHLTTVLSCIKSTERWAKAALLLVSRSTVPWSDCVKDIVHQGLNYDQYIANKFKQQLQQVGLKEILVKYERKDLPLSDPRAVDLLINYIFKQGRDSALDDAKKVTLSYFGTLDSPAYFKFMSALLRLKKIDQLFDLFLDIPFECQIENAARLVHVVSLFLDDGDILYQPPEDIKCWIDAGLYMAEFLKTKKCDCYDLAVSNGLKSLQKLQKEFNIHVPLPDVMDKEKTFKIIEEEIISSLDKEVIIQQQVKPKNKEETAFAIRLHKINRLCDVLFFEWAKVVAVIITKCLERGLYDLVIQLCGELTSSYPSQSYETLMQVVDHFNKNLQRIGNMSFDMLFTTIRHLCNLAITFCPNDALEDCLHVTKLSNYLSIVHKITGSQNFLPPTFATDEYQKWKLSPLYTDKGFQLDVNVVVDFVQKLLPLLQSTYDLEKETDFRMEDFYKLEVAPLIKHMNQRGQHLASLCTMLLFFHLPLNFLQKEPTFEKAYQLVQKGIEETVTELLKRIIDSRKLDLDFGINLLLIFPNEPIQIIENLKKWSSKDIRCVMSLGELCSEYYRLSDKLFESSEYDKIYRRAFLLSKQKIKTTSADVALKLDTNESWDIVKHVIMSPNVCLSTVLECCNAFDLVADDVLVAYLNNLLKEAEKICTSKAEICEGSATVILNKAKCVIDTICSEELVENLENIVLKKIGLYSYEVLLFLHQQILNVSANISTVNSGYHILSIELLNFLRVYDRTSPLSETEKNIWISKHSVDSKVPPISSKRLPFWLTLKKSYVYKIINPELSADNITIWLSVAPKFNLSEDELVIVAVKNTVIDFLKKSPSEDFNPNKDEAFLSNISKTLKHIKEPELAVSTASWVTKHMPPGMNKVYCCKLAVQFAGQWLCRHPEKRESDMPDNIFNLLQLSHIETILHQYNFANDTTMSLACYPVQLIEYLIEQACGEVDASIKVCQLSNQVSKICRVDLSEIFFTFFSKWLTDSSFTSDHLDESTFDFTADRLCVEESIDRNLLRTMNLLLGISDIKYNILEALCKKMQDMENILRIRLIFCTVSVYGAATCAEALKLPASVFKPSTLVLCLCLSEIESLHQTYSIDMIANCNKVELVQRLLSDHGNNIKVLLVCIRLCLEFNIWEVNIWKIYLLRLVKLSMADKLEDILQTAQGNLVHMWHCESFVSAWNCVISGYFKNDSADPKAIIDKVQKAFLSCKCASMLNLESVWADLKYFIKSTTGKEPCHPGQDLNLHSFIKALEESKVLLDS